MVQAITKILLVEDDRDFAFEVVKAIKAVGILIEHCVSAEDAFKALYDDGNFNLVIADIVLPDLNGLELVRRLSLLDRDKPIYAIIITGYPTFENVVAALQENVVEFLVKPIVFSDLLNAIRKAEKIINAIGSV